MTTREKMIRWRNATGITLRQLSDRSGVSESLLSMVESGHVTHPKIVAKIQRLYRLTDEEAEVLLPENYRKSSPNYDPDRYRIEAPPFTDGAIARKKDMIEIYIAEHNDMMARANKKRRAH